MKVSISTPASYINQTYVRQENSPPVATPPATGTQTDGARQDSIHLSNKIQEMKQVRQAMDNESGERGKRVAALREQVQSNQYTVNAEQVAEKMIGGIFNLAT